jgi:hypothetical protein
MIHDPGNELVEVASFLTAMEADMARGFLEANGVEAVLTNENMARMGIHFSAIMGGIRLLVRRADEAVARELLESGAEPLEEPPG